MTLKVCTKCKKELEVEGNFPKGKRYKDGIRSWCRLCDNACRKEYRKLNPPKRHEKEYIAKKMREFRIRNPSNTFYWNARQRAIKLGLPFSIKEEDIIIPTTCPVFSIPLVRTSKLQSNSATLDRIIPELGYVPGNIAVISLRANQLKNNASLEELEKLVGWLRQQTQ